jgi:hypothetical protein
MAKPNGLVARSVSLDPPLRGDPADHLRTEGGAWLRLDGERRARIDPEDPRAAGFVRVLDGLARQGLPVYVEIEPDRSVVTRILIPLISRVDASRSTDQGLEVTLAASHARHLVARDDPDFAELERSLAAAFRDRSTILVTEDEAHRIIDIQTLAPDPERPLPPFPEPVLPVQLVRPWWWRFLVAIWWWPWWPWCWFWWWLRCRSAANAQLVFDAMAARSCDPLTVPAPCIPFLYPDDGCWARAHEMSRLMINMGVSPAKVWIRGNLHVNTRNNPSCFVDWGWHVAPTICVRDRFPFSHRAVIDPSLFTTPVTPTTWKSVQGDPGASLTYTSWVQYWPQAGTTDPAFVDTNQRLAYYRLQLQLRATQFGPPPYAACP